MAALLMAPSLVLVATPTDGMRGVGGGGGGGIYIDTIDTDTVETECLNISSKDRSGRQELHAADATLSLSCLRA